LANSGPPIWNLEPPLLTNRDLERVQANQGESGRPALILRLNREGAAKLARLTAANPGRRVAVAVDGRILITPTIRGPIAGGTVSIQGFNSQQEALYLSDLLQTAPLPLRLELVGN
jgi:preprotein translocase subunit SecD